MDVFVGVSIGDYKLMRNNGDGIFIDVIVGFGVEGMIVIGIENVIYDFNNDGNLDIVFNGNIFIGNGDFIFVLVNNFLLDNNGVFGDLNNDGYIDSFLEGNIYMNNGGLNYWLIINIIGVESNINGLGVCVEIESVLGI